MFAESLVIVAPNMTSETQSDVMEFCNFLLWSVFDVTKHETQLQMNYTAPVVILRHLSTLPTSSWPMIGC